MIEAEVVCDSIGEHSPRLTTFRLRYPKFVHGELMTHRAFSRNASSSRAIPVSKNLEEVRSDELRAAPVWWGREQKGMQSGDELDDIELIYAGRDSNGISRQEAAKQQWRTAALHAAKNAEYLHEIGAHKSIINRILEPFLHINVVVTSCAPGLMNFFGLRLDKAAQPEIRILAEYMWGAWNESNPEKLGPGEWHLPFIEWQGLQSDFDTRIAHEPLLQQCIKVSVARCARTSYLSFDTGKRSTVEEDLALYERLVGSQPGHFSPAEHQATPDKWYPSQYANDKDTDGFYEWPLQHGNLPGWRQYRKTLPGEAVAPLPEGYSL